MQWSAVCTRKHEGEGAIGRWSFGEKYEKGEKGEERQNIRENLKTKYT
jgi:hypothetical protein